MRICCSFNCVLCVSVCGCKTSKRFHFQLSQLSTIDRHLYMNVTVNYGLRCGTHGTRTHRNKYIERARE